MKTIALVSNTAWSIYNFRAGLIRSLIKDGFRVVTIAPKDPFSDRLALMGCETFDIRIDNQGANFVADFFTLFQFWSSYRRLQPEVILHFTIKPNIYGSFAARFNGVPCLNTITGLGTAFIRESWLTYIARALYRVSQRWPTKVFFQNPDDMAFFVNQGLVKADRALQLPGSGINLTRFGVVPKPESDVTVFLLIARMLWDKGIGEFVAAAIKIRGERDDVKFQLLGALDVANRTAIPRIQIAEWESKGIVEYLGETDDVRPFIQRTDCVVLPSYREGTPRSLLEAIAMERPVITTDTVGCREVVDHGINGFLARVKDPDDLADKMREFIHLSRTSRLMMGRAGRIKAEKQFDEKIVIKKYSDAINEILPSVKQESDS